MILWLCVHNQLPHLHLENLWWHDRHHYCCLRHCHFWKCNIWWRDDINACMMCHYSDQSWLGNARPLSNFPLKCDRVGRIWVCMGMLMLHFLDLTQCGVSCWQGSNKIALGKLNCPFITFKQRNFLRKDLCAKYQTRHYAFEMWLYMILLHIWFALSVVTFWPPEVAITVSYADMTDNKCDESPSQSVYPWLHFSTTRDFFSICMVRSTAVLDILQYIYLHVQE